MICKNCGANIKNGSKYCEFCGSQITLEMQKEMEQLNKAGCPKCGSSNIKFEREKLGENKNKKGVQIVRATIGICNDCGYTWESSDKNEKNDKKIWLWVLGWIFIFPVPLTILMLNNKKINKTTRYIIIALGWLMYLCIGLGNDSSNLQSENVITVEESSNIMIDANINSEDKTVLFSITAEDSVDKKMNVEVNNDNGFKESQNITILNNGKGYTSEFNDNGQGLKGLYHVIVKDENGLELVTKDFEFN